jgi:hypothetical protein
VATRDALFAAPPPTYRLPWGGNGPQTSQIALRVWTCQPIAFWFGVGSKNGNNSEVGAPALLTTCASMLMIERAYHFVTEFVYGLSSGLIGLAILALFLYSRSDKEPLWLAISLLGQCATLAFHLVMDRGLLPSPLWRVLG